MKDPKNRKAFGTLLLLITAVIWGMAFAFQRAGMEWIEPATFQAVRLALASLTVWIVSFIMDRRKARSASPQMQEELVRPRKETLIGGICCGTFLALSRRSISFWSRSSVSCCSGKRPVGRSGLRF